MTGACTLYSGGTGTSQVLWPYQTMEEHLDRRSRRPSNGSIGSRVEKMIPIASSICLGSLNFFFAPTPQCPPLSFGADLRCRTRPSSRRPDSRAQHTSDTTICPRSLFYLIISLSSLQKRDVAMTSLRRKLSIGSPQ